MEIVALLLSAYKLGRALLSGGKADSAAGDLVAAFLRPLLAGQNETLKALDRIEATLGRVETQRHSQGLSVGWDCLRDATAAHRTSDERTHLLRTAQHEFRTAAATAPDGPSGVTAQLLVAACWIARGDTIDTLSALADAAGRAREDLYGHAAEYAQPSNALQVWQSSEGTSSRFFRNVFDGGTVSYDNPALAATRAQLRVTARARRDQAADLYNQVQQVRAAYGEHDAACAPVIGFYEPGVDDLSARPASELRISAYITNSPVVSWVHGQPIDLDGVRLELTNSPAVFPADNGHRVEFGLSAVLSRPDVTLAISPCWPYDHSPDPISSRTLLGQSFFRLSQWTWSGARMAITENRDFRVAGHTTQRPVRIVAHQYGVMAAGRRNMLLAALPL